MSKIIRNNYQNCYQLLISSLFSDIGINEKMCWYISKPFYDIKNKRIYSFDYDNIMYKYIWKEYDSILLNKKKDSNITSFIDTILEKLHNHNIGIFLDIFHLPYSIYHQKIHSLHAIQINKGIYQDEFNIIDHYYNFEGIISREALENSLISNNNKFKYFYLSKNNQGTKSGISLEEKIKLNYTDKLEYSLEEIKVRIYEIIQIMNIIERQDEIKNLYEDLKNLAGSEKMLANFCAEANKMTHTDFSLLSSMYEKNSQKINLLANIIMKNAMKNSHNYVNEYITQLIADSLDNILSINQHIKRI